MITLSCSYELTSDIVVKSSKQLDELLNEYHTKAAASA
ncbi:Spo0E family sporulation regulatory protein-aspartic acid phosphatase [Virgibacillus dakarensis]|nr:Spo0E family sporulation regulatory protein-aspartic acid phosphatase [Virgibacillus dakarensis]MTW87513.1 Spo0E family sporulation regulatory protein-aspartic acid phosphatase [Virgibacillus dakarensis]